MELVIKLYSDQPSRVGIKYVYDYLAVKAYEDLVRNRPNPCFSLYAEPNANLLTITLVCQDTGNKFLYRSVSFKPDQLVKLRHHLQVYPQLQFVHTYPKHNGLLVAKPFKREIFLNITALELVSTGNFNT